MAGSMVTSRDRVVHHGLCTDKTDSGVVVLRCGGRVFTHGCRFRNGRGHIGRCGRSVTGLCTFHRCGIILWLPFASSAASSRAPATSPATAAWFRLRRSCVRGGYGSGHRVRWDIEAERELRKLALVLINQRSSGAESLIRMNQQQ